MDAGDPFDLQRFVTAQAPVMPAVMAELKAGAKRSHWMWFVLGVQGRSAHAIFGSPDDLKLRSCLTLFHAADPAETLFAECLARYRGGVPDTATAGLLGADGGGAEGAYSSPL